MGQFRKKPIVIEARLFTGALEEFGDFVEWADGPISGSHKSVGEDVEESVLYIDTLEGSHDCEPR